MMLSFCYRAQTVYSRTAGDLKRHGAHGIKQCENYDAVPYYFHPVLQMPVLCNM